VRGRKIGAKKQLFSTNGEIHPTRVFDRISRNSINQYGYSLADKLKLQISRTLSKSDPFFVFSNDPFFFSRAFLIFSVFSTFDVSSREPGRRRNHDLIIIDDGFACAPDRVREVTLAGRRRG